MKGQKENKKIKMESWNAPVLAQAKSSQRISPWRDQSRWAFFGQTRTSEFNHAQARSHLAQAQLG